MLPRFWSIHRKCGAFFSAKSMVGLPSASICHKRRALFGGIMPLESDSLPHHWHPKSLASKIFSTMPTWSIYPHRTCSSSNPDGFEITTLWVMESDQCSHLQRMAAARHFPLTLIRSREKKGNLYTLQHSWSAQNWWILWRLPRSQTVCWDDIFKESCCATGS